SGRTKELNDRSHHEPKKDEEEPKPSATDYVKAMQIRARAQAALNEFFAKYDVVIGASYPAVAPPIDKNLDESLPFGDPMGGAGNMAGLPAVGIPCGFAGPGKLPVSVQIMGKPFDEAKVLSVAALFQSRTSWHRERPPVG